MAKANGLRRWATPLTMGSFLLMAGTGVLMFFEQDGGLVTVVHQWFSWIFLLGAGAHLLVNLRPLTNHLASPGGKVSVALFTLVLLASLSSWGLITGPALKRPIESALVDAPLSALAGITHKTPEALLGRLKERGIDASVQQSIRELAEQTRIDENELLALVFLAAPSEP